MISGGMRYLIGMLDRKNWEIRGKEIIHKMIPEFFSELKCMHF